MHPTKRAARIAGLLYLLMGIPAAFALMYVPRRLLVPGNASATANNILAHEMLFRIGIVTGLFSSVLFIVVVFALYRLFHAVNKSQAMLMVALVLVSVAFGLASDVGNLVALALFRGGEFLTVFDKPQRDALGMLFLRAHTYGIYMNEIFWGLWLLPFGALVKNSGFIPRILGVLLLVNGFAYVGISLTSLLLPAYANLVFRASMPALLGELWIMFWLLIKGAKVQALEAPAP